MAAIDEQPGIAREGGGIARHHRDARHLRGGERRGLGARTGPGRIHDGGVEAVELGAAERRALQITPCRRKASLEPGAARRLLQRFEHGEVLFDGMDRAAGSGKGQAERATAREQIGDAPGVADGIIDRAPERAFGGCGRLKETPAGSSTRI